MNQFDDAKVITGDTVKDNLGDAVNEGLAVQQTKTDYITAVRVAEPRQLKRVETMVLAEVEFDPEGMYYEWEVYDKRQGRMVPITGITIGAAMSIARNYGNCAVDIHVDETATHYLFSPVFLDIETGFTFRRLFKQRKGQNLGGKMDAARAEDITFQIGQSKAIRNCVRGAVPAGIVSKILKRAKECVEKDIKKQMDGAGGREKIIDDLLLEYAKKGVKLEHLGEYTGITDPAKWSIDIIGKLKTALRAIEDTTVAVTDLFPSAAKTPVEQGPKVSGDASALDKKKDKPKTRGRKKKDAEDIKTDPETASEPPEVPEVEIPAETKTETGEDPNLFTQEVQGDDKSGPGGFGADDLAADTDQ